MSLQGSMLLGEKLSRGPVKSRLWACRALVQNSQKLPASFGQNWPHELVRALPGPPAALSLSVRRLWTNLLDYIRNVREPDGLAS